MCTPLLLNYTQHTIPIHNQHGSCSSTIQLIENYISWLKLNAQKRVELQSGRAIKLLCATKRKRSASIRTFMCTDTHTAFKTVSGHLIEISLPAAKSSLECAFRTLYTTAFHVNPIHVGRNAPVSLLFI